MAKIHWSGPGSLQCAVSWSRGLHAARHLSQDAQSFLGLSKTSPDTYCVTCTKAARLALAKESAPKPASRCATSGCGSYAINPGQSGRDNTSDLDLCDVCYWRKRAESATWPTPRPISEARETEILGYCPDIGWRRLSQMRRKWALTGAEYIADYEPTHFLPLPPGVL